MSPRRNRRVSSTGGPERPRVTGESIESWSDGDWVVRSVPGGAGDQNGPPGAVGGKRYRCPGCDQEIPASMPHLVCWPADDGGVERRRHWHRPCWRARDRRGPRVPRSRRGTHLPW